MSEASGNRVRPTAVAGTFYPRDSHTLAATVDGLLAEAAVRHSRAAQGSLRAVIVPHAGYVYSGPIAATAYAELRSCVARFRRVVVIGPAHRVPVRGLAVSSADEFATPLGAVTVDVAARETALPIPGVVVDDAAHALEHSVEVQLPFLQRVAPGLPVLPLLVGAAPTSVVRALFDTLWDDGTLLVVSDRPQPLPRVRTRACGRYQHCRARGGRARRTRSATVTRVAPTRCARSSK